HNGRFRRQKSTKKCFRQSIQPIAKQRKEILAGIAGLITVIPAGFCFSQTMPSSMKNLIFNDFLPHRCKNSCKTRQKSPRKTFQKTS
ncbi:MAG: hypothetical protein OXE85_14285, partial [Roseovarius sp.]|nr:hypothetical protein [Roseovarius sp.]